MSTLLNISAIARRTGVAADTLRKWEQRYGVLEPQRTAGGQRRYTEQDVARVEWLRDRLAEGWRIGEAARVLRSGSAPALSEPVDLRDALVAATAAEDPVTVGALLDQVFATLPLDRAFAEVVSPALRELGDAWRRGDLTIAEEHSFTSKVRSRLEELLAEDRPAVRGIAVLACAPGEQHELGLLMLAVMLRADGWRVEYLGPSMPVDETVGFAVAVGASLVCLSAGQEQTAAELTTALHRLERAGLPTIALGGAGVDASMARSLSAVYANGELTATVARLREAGQA
jgi:DNA-binding transcriptional MerR regulator